MTKEFNIKVGDKLIANDEFKSYSGAESFEVIKVTPYNMEHSTYGQSEITHGVTLFLTGKRRDDITGEEYWYNRKIETCNFKINPINLEINIDWSSYGSYCKAIFWTSEEEKKEWYKKFNEYKKNQCLNQARWYGYKG